MNAFGRRLARVFLCTALALSLAAAADDDDDKVPDAPRAGSGSAVTAEQGHALGIVVGHPLVAQMPDRIESLGVVLDTTTLVGDLGDLSAVGASEQSTKAEVTRLQGLYGAGAGASLKMLEAAKVEQVKAAAQSRVSMARFEQHWGALAGMPAAERQKWLTTAARGQSLLLRADVPGRHSLTSLPSAAELNVDGVGVPGRVLGVMRQTDETQSVGLLIGVEHAPAGLGPGARLPVVLLMAKRSGLLLPRDAVLYDEQGAYVFKQLTNKPGPGKTSYARHNIKLLLRHGEGWLVEGVDDDDDIVMQGAGALWSLQGTVNRVADDDD